MEPNTATNSAPDPRKVFVGVPDLMLRYGRSRSTVYDLVRHPDFPARLPGKRWRLDHIENFEDLVADGRIDLGFDDATGEAA